MSQYIPLLSVIFIIILILLVWPWIAKQIPNPTQKILAKTHDTELLKLIYSLKNPISPEKVKDESPLVLSEIRNRLRLLMMCGAIHPIQEANGNIKSYSKKNPLPQIETAFKHKELSTQEIKSLLEEHLQSSDLHTGQIAVLFHLRILEAEKLLNQWAKEGLVQISYYKGFHKLYTLNNSPLASVIPAEDIVDINNCRKIDQKAIAYIANENKGIITPLLLGRDQKISLPEAKIALDNLTELGVLRKEADYYIGTIEYRINAKN